MSKTIKVLSDGTIAKVNMIVVIIEYNHGNRIGTITKILKVYPNDNSDLNVEARVPFENLDWFYARPECLRKATSEERKQYYTKLWQKQ